MTIIRYIAVLLCVTLTACASSQETPDATYYLVRHAEKVLDVDNPPLTDIGQQRAQDFAAQLGDRPISAIYSSDYKRTRDTAAPLAQAKALTVQLYDPSDLDAFAKSLLTQTGHIVVVGHSNTTPPLAARLGTEPGPDIREADEYDRLYVIKRTGEIISGEIVRYGAPSPSD